MTHPYIPPQPGGPGAYEQQLTARAHRAEQDRATLETELGQARQRNAELQQRAEQAEAALAALHEGEEPHEDERTWPTPAQWVWRWNRATVAERLRRAEQATADAEHALHCRFARWEERAREAEAQARELRGRLDAAESRLAELEEDEGDWMSGMLWARKLSILNVPLVSPAFTGDTTDPWEAAAEAARQHELVKQRIAEHLASDPVPGAQQVVILPPQSVRPGPILAQPCAVEPFPGLNFDDMATLINEYRMPERRGEAQP